MTTWNNLKLYLSILEEKWLWLYSVIVLILYVTFALYTAWAGGKEISEGYRWLLPQGIPLFVLFGFLQATFYQFSHKIFEHFCPDDVRRAKDEDDLAARLAKKREKRIEAAKDEIKLAIKTEKLKFEPNLEALRGVIDREELEKLAAELFSELMLEKDFSDIQKKSALAIDNMSIPKIFKTNPLARNACALLLVVTLICALLHFIKVLSFLASYVSF